MNSVFLIGRLTKDPEIKEAGETKVCNMGLAINREDGKTADFFDLAAFGKTAETMAKYLSKGSKIAVSGSLRQNTYTDKEGKKRNHVSVVVGRFEFADSKSSGQQAEVVEDDEIPFA